MAKIVTYECDKCGCEVTVTETPETQLSPLYCCGSELQEVSSNGKPAGPKKKAVKKSPKKTVSKAAPKKAAKKTAKKK